MSLKEKINYDASQIQCCTEKAKVLLNFVLDEVEAPAKYCTLAYFTNIMLDEINQLSEHIEKATFDMTD